MSSAAIVVIGGGVAGITAALDCAERGSEVTLVEVRPRLGGAAYSFQRDGLELDNGQHVFLRCCTAYRALLTRLYPKKLVRAALVFTSGPRLFDVPGAVMDAALARVLAETHSAVNVP